MHILRDINQKNEMERGCFEENCVGQKRLHQTQNAMKADCFLQVVKGV